LKKRNHNLLIVVLGLLVSLSFINSAQGIQRVWTNVSGNNLWDDSINWIPIGVPSSLDTVITSYSDVLTIPSNYTASIAHIRHLGNLTIEFDAILNITGGDFDCNGEVDNFGTIHVLDSPEYGFRQSSYQSNSRPVTNEGTIIVENSAWAGLWIRYDQTFTNKPGAQLEIINSGAESIELLGTLSNQGIIKAYDSGVDIGLLMEDPESNLINLKCAKLDIKDQIKINNGMLSNFGYLLQNYDGINEIDNNLVINYGSIEDIFESFQYNDVNNLGLCLHPFGESVGEGQPIHLFDSQMPSDAIVSNVFTERALINSAGTYDYSTNIWIPNSQAVGDSIFFVELTQDNGNCMDTLKFLTANKVESVNYWIGNTGNWQFGFNWNFGTVPTSSERVAIYNATDTVNVPIGYDAVVKDMILKGKMTIQVGGKLSILNPEKDHGILMEEAELINNGTLKINNAQNGISAYASTIINNNNFDFSGNDIGILLTRIELVGSTMSNHGTIQSDSSSVYYSFRSVVYNYGAINAITADLTPPVLWGDSLHNYGTINLVGNGMGSSQGIGSSIYNSASGVINVQKYERGIESSTFNEGAIYVDSCAVGISPSVHDITNQSGGLLRATNCLEGFDSRQFDFYNEVGGKMESSVNEIGLIVGISGQLINKGIVEIDSSSVLGIDLRSNLICEQNSIFEINNVDGIGVQFDSSNSNLNLVDNAQFQINNTTSENIKLEEGNISMDDNSKLKLDNSQ